MRIPLEDLNLPLDEFTKKYPTHTTVVSVPKEHPLNKEAEEKFNEELTKLKK